MRAFILLLPLLLFGDESVLSQLKRQELQNAAKKAEVEASKLATSWINPIQMNYLYQKGNQFPNQLLESFTIRIDQPIFKSLGIWEAIKYAKAKRGESLQDIALQKKRLIAKVYELAFKIKRLDLELRRQRLAIENAKIDVRVKKEQYLSGELDGTFLDNAILQKNRLALALLDLKSRFVELKSALKDLSDLDPEQIQLPHLKIVDRKRFIQKNIELSKIRAAKEASRHFKNMTVSRYLPSVSLLYSYNYQKVEGSQFFPEFRYKDHFLTYGIRISMPLFDINAKKNIESAKLDYIRSGLELAQKKRTLLNLYRKSLRSLDLVNEKIALTREDVALYEQLVRQTKERYEAGEKTIYDLQTMTNSLEQKRIDLQMFMIDKQLILLELYRRIEGAF